MYFGIYIGICFESRMVFPEINLVYTLISVLHYNIC